MDIETIKQFIAAGYTKEDIEKMEAGSAPEAEQGAADETTGQEQGDAVQENAGAVSPGGMADAVKALQATVSNLTETVKAMQAAAVSGASVESNDDKSISAAMQSFLDTL